jgi:hypothetical protein
MLSSCPLTTASPWPVDDAPSSGLSSLLSPPPPALPIVCVCIYYVYTKMDLPAAAACIYMCLVVVVYSSLDII